MREIEKVVDEIVEFFYCAADRQHFEEKVKATLLSERDAARREAVEECAKILDGREWSARQGAKDALTDGSRFFQCGEEKAYRDGANHLRTLLPPATGTSGEGKP